MKNLFFEVRLLISVCLLQLAEAICPQEYRVVLLKGIVDFLKCLPDADKRPIKIYKKPEFMEDE